MANQVNPDQRMVLTLAALQEVLNYISTRPYAEVFNVVETLKQSRTLDSVIAEATAASRTTNPPITVTPISEEAPKANEA